MGINKQRAFRHEELKILFRQCKDEELCIKCGDRALLLVPLIGLFTGARLNEVCQLNPNTDIKQDMKTGIYYFHFTDEGLVEGIEKSIKTSSSRRIVPIHSKLIELGFLDYVDHVKSGGHKIIFPSWPPNHGKASAKVSKWFINLSRA